MTDMTADLEFVTDGRGTGCRIVSGLAFFHDSASRVVTFERPLDYLADEEIIEIAERIKAHQAAIAKAHGQEEER